MDLLALDTVKELCKVSENPVIIFNSEGECVFFSQKDFAPPETNFCGLIKNFSKPGGKVRTEYMSVKGRDYCAKILNFDELYICEFFELNALADMAEKAGLYERLMPVLSVFERNTETLWQTISELYATLAKNKTVGDLGELDKLRKCAINLDAAEKNLFEYMHMRFCRAMPAVLDAAALVDGVVSRCNELLRDCGRRIDFICDGGEYMISVSGRHCINALANALQNALLYSPFDSVPTAELRRTARKNVPYAELTIKNMSVLFSRGKNSEENFCYQRLGYGIPIIRTFAEESGGSFSIEKKNGITTVSILIPMAANSGRSTVVIKEGTDAAFYNEVDRLLASKMLEVSEFFSTN